MAQSYVQYATLHRNEFMKKIGDAVAIIPSSSEIKRNPTTHYRFRPNSDFYYLTGFSEPDAILVIVPNHPVNKTILFVRPKDPEMETWTGRREGPHGAVQNYCVDASYNLDLFESMLPDILSGYSRLYYQLSNDHLRTSTSSDKTILNVISLLKNAKRRHSILPFEISDPSQILHEMRLIKRPHELDLMRKAANIAYNAHKASMLYARDGMYEYEIEAVIEYIFKSQGAGVPGYNTIVASGNNSTILHYTENDAILKSGDLLLVDAGGEYGFYTADVTRTFPINGKFTTAQKDVYDIVLASQIAAIDEVKPNKPFSSAHSAAVSVLTEGLVSLGILKGSRDSLIEQKSYAPFYMHQTGHFLGLDVHDVGAYGENSSRLLESGMVTTVEPGLYFDSKDERIPAVFRGIGIRIEDNVLVTDFGNEILTSTIPKTTADIEDLMANKPLNSLRDLFHY